MNLLHIFPDTIQENCIHKLLIKQLRFYNNYFFIFLGCVYDTPIYNDNVLLTYPVDKYTIYIIYIE